MVRALRRRRATLDRWLPDPDTVRLLMAEIGFVPRGEAWRWRGADRQRSAVTIAPARPGNAFAALAEMKK